MSPRTVYSELGAKIKQCEVTLTCDLVFSLCGEVDCNSDLAESAFSASREKVAQIPTKKVS